MAFGMILSVSRFIQQSASDVGKVEKNLSMKIGGGTEAIYIRLLR
jgi:hypothetical protein